MPAKLGAVRSFGRVRSQACLSTTGAEVHCRRSLTINRKTRAQHRDGACVNQLQHNGVVVIIIEAEADLPSARLSTRDRRLGGVSR